MITNYVKNLNWGYVAVMCIGNIFIGMGVAIFKLAGLGNDPFNGMNMALADCIGISYGNFVVLINLVLFIIQLIFGRVFIGFGTIINATLIGYIATFFYDIFIAVYGVPVNMVEQIVIMLIGVIIISFGLSMYQMPNVGVAPYDCLSLIMANRWRKIPYFWCRISNDAICALVCYLAGGIIGLGTLACAFGLGVVIQFFNTYFTSKLLRFITRKTIAITNFNMDKF